MKNIYFKYQHYPGGALQNILSEVIVGSLVHQTHILNPAVVDLFQVSTADQRRTSPKTMISCNKKTLYLPQEMPAIHLEFTEYYFPDGKDYPSKSASCL